MESIISTFHIDWKIIIAQAINFGVVFTVLYIFALKPLSKLMEERSKKIEQGMDDAKVNANILSKTKEEYESALAQARREVNEIFQNGKKEADQKRAEMLEDARNEVSTMIENGKRNLEAEKIKMIEEAKKEIVVLAMKATEKLIESKIDGSFDKKTAKELHNL